jgi:hypothetical protein
MHVKEAMMDEQIDYEDIFTPHGLLGEVSKHSNLDFLMNICNIPRVYSVSGFGKKMSTGVDIFYNVHQEQQNRRKIRCFSRRVPDLSEK